MILYLTALWTCLFAGATSSCVPYWSADPQCASAHPLCTAVDPYGTLTLEDAESLLYTLFSDVDRAVQNGTLTQQCRRAFSLLYCHQVYRRCTESSNSSAEYDNGRLCEDECSEAMRECQQDLWFLVELVDSLAVPLLPPLTTNCSTGELPQEDCITLTSGNETSSEDCAPDPPTDADTTLIIILICVCLGVPILLCSLLLVAMTLCYCSSSSGEQGGRGDDVEDAGGNLEYIQPGYPNPVPQDYHKNTLLMRPGNIRDAFLGLDNAAPTGTFARNLRTKEYLKMTPKQRLHALEFPHNNICITKHQAENSFGSTYIGEAMGLNENEPTTTVFIKSLRNDAAEVVQQQFMAEMTWASGYSHPNILSLLAVCNREEPRYMVFEHLVYGTLKHFLHTLDSAWMDFDEMLNEEASTAASTASPALGVDDMIGLGIQVADGMEYLSAKGLVHKDLAARNCHVGQRLEVKIANFGLSYLPHSKEYCIISSCSKTSPVPLRWLAPESLEHGKFSPHSDSWSFGILLWEIFTFGEHPYSDCSNAQVVKNIVRRSLLDVPENVPRSIYGLIHKCWQRTPIKRPLFTAISRELGNALGGLDSLDLKRFGKFPSTPEINNKTL